VQAVEIDAQLAAALRRRFPGLDVSEADALRILLPREPFRVVANLPFDGATRILRRFLDPRSHLLTADVIVDWGLAAKRTAVWPGTQLSAYWGAWFELSLVRRLTRSVFAPPPSVDAALVRVVRRKTPLVPVSERHRYEAFLARAHKDGPRAVVSPRCLKRCATELGFERTARPRDLDAAQWARLWQSVRGTV
jgi:23S rRNA (adenine-N6)-dimethyltransferase